MKPVAVGVQFGFGEGVREGNRVFFAEEFGLLPGVAFDFEAFERSFIGKMTEGGVGELVEKEKLEILGWIDVIN